MFWIGVPDLLFGLSAPIVAWLAQRNTIGSRALIGWNLVGFALIVVPTFGPMHYWMNEPGFRFIFEFPMVLAPAVVVPLFVSLNLLHAWGIWSTTRGKDPVSPPSLGRPDPPPREKDVR